MDLNDDTLNIQGIFLNLEKNYGNLKRIKYRGGHEATIVETVRKLHKFLATENYLKNDKVNHIFEKKLKNIVTFLVFNTELKKRLEDPTLEHLTGIMPQLSTCLLANIIIELDLCQIYCDVLLKLDLDFTEELLVEMLPCLKWQKPKNCSCNTHLFLQLIVKKVSAVTQKDSDYVEKITDLASEMLLNLGGLFGDQAKNIKLQTVHELLGLNLLASLNLLLQCAITNCTSKLMESLLQTCKTIMMVTTVDVFVSWAEIDYESQMLQSIIAEKAYHFIEKYQKYGPAKELISLLGPMAKKPKSLNEQILCSDISTTIRMINKADPNQKAWFTSLLNSQVFTDKESTDCLDKWSHLCSLSDVSRLLTMTGRTKDPRAKKLAVKCAATLNQNELGLAILRHFHQNGLGVLNDNIQQDLVILFNKLHDKRVDEEFSKSLNLLLLQNPKETLRFVFRECLRRTFFSRILCDIMGDLKEVARVEGVGLKLLEEEIAQNLPDEHNSKNYTNLLRAFIEVEFYTMEDVIMLILLPIIQAYSKPEITRIVLGMLNALEGRIVNTEKIEPFIAFLFDLMEQCRCNFFSFNALKQEIVKEIVDIFEKFCRLYIECNHSGKADIFVNFYKQKLHQIQEVDILEHFSLATFKDTPEIVAQLAGILPLCVSQEWILIISNLVMIHGIGKMIDVLCDVMVILCHLVETQVNKQKEIGLLLEALKYNFHNFGIAVKEVIQPKQKSLEDDVIITKSISRLLMNNSLENMTNEGLSLANLLSDVSLKSLKNDQKFLRVVASIKDLQIRQLLARKTLN